jgi:hypothetical protein
MPFWDGDRWIDDRPQRTIKPHAKLRRSATWLATLAMIVVPLVGVIPRDSVSAGNRSPVIKIDHANQGIGHTNTPDPGTSPAPASSVAPTSTSTPTPTPVAVATPAPTAPTSTPPPTPTPTGTTTATPTPTPTAASTGGRATPAPIQTPVPTTAPTATPAPTPDPTVFYVSTTGSDSSVGSSTTPWRTIAKAVATAPSGSTIRIFGGTYAAFIVRRAGLTISPVSGNTVTVSGGTSAITIYASDTVIRGLHVTNSSAQGVWVDSVSDVLLSGLTVQANLGHGIQIIRSTRVEVTGSQISSNKLSGIRELDGTSAGRYLGNVITDNGHDGQPYNGDGLLMKGSGAVVRGNTILHNGDSTIYEHGIYASTVAIGYLIEDNVLRDNGASGIKASGSGAVTGNNISGSPRGIVFADDGGIVRVTSNSVSATLYAILVTSNCNLTRYRSDYNTFVVDRFGYLGQALDLPAWRTISGDDLHSQ